MLNRQDNLAYVLVLPGYAEVIEQQARALFDLAAYSGCLGMLTYLESKVSPEKVQAMIAVGNFWPFKGAAANGHLEVVCYLESKAPDKVQAMIAADDFWAFRMAATHGHLEVLRYLQSKAPAKVQAMIGAADFWAFRWAVNNNQVDVLQHLLGFASVFAYAEAHQREYGAIVIPYLEQQILNLRTRKQAFEQAHPNAVFDVGSDEEGDLLFYYARQLIRRNDPALRDALLLLLELPGVKARAHRAIRGGVPNELLRLALSVNNQMAAELLLAIPAVRQEAEAHDYYRDEQQGALDLGQLARDRESSMTALSQGEQQRLQGVLTRYQPLLTAAGITNCMQDLREELVSRYEAHPATVLVPGEKAGQSKTLVLPMQWSAFQDLKLAEPYYSAALKAYYAHKAHSAWRYLLKPNPWMHERASYVYVDEQNPQEKWSTFEEYQPLIAVLYLAAIDQETAASDGYTLETRLTHFIDELALIGRAHNWDDTRSKLDKQGNPIQEEYDNLQGDRPSCFSGVKRRLFQAVQGHPLLVFLTKELLTQEANGFIRDYFKAAIQEHNRQPIKVVWDKFIAGDALTAADWATLKQLDVPKAKQEELISTLKQKYAMSFTGDMQFQRLLEQMFAFKKTPDAHLLNFGHLHLETLLNSPLSVTQGMRFFAVAATPMRDVLSKEEDNPYGLDLTQEQSVLNFAGMTVVPPHR